MSIRIDDAREMRRRLAAALFAVVALSSPLHLAVGADPISELRRLPQTPREAREAEKRDENDAKREEDPKLAKQLAKVKANRAAARRTEALSDRNVYWNDDGQGQFVVILHEYDLTQPGLKAKITLAGDKGEVGVTEMKIDAADPSNKLTFLLNTDALTPGNYTVTVNVLGADGAVIGRAEPCTFKRENKSHPHVPIPSEGVPVEVHPQEMLPDATWPITTGIPMPFGTLRDPAELRLLENGKAVPAQWTVRSTWTPGTPTFVRWLTLDFVAKYDGTKPREYRITKASGEKPAAGIRVEQTDKLITVQNGLSRFEVKRQGYNGINAAWLDSDGNGQFADSEQLVNAQAAPSGAGPFLVDEKGLVYRASDDPTAEIVVEEQGPVRVTILARGWYVNSKLPEDERKLCQFVTRITAYAGCPMIFFNHRTVLTYDTNEKKLADVGFRAGMSGAQRWMTGMDGAAAQGELPARQSVWIHQERADRVRLVEGETDAAKREGKRADGWMAATGPSGTAAVLLKDIWQKFPKELEVDRQGPVLHFWPRHGRETFSEAEQLDRRNIYKCWFAEHGKFLDMQFPKSYYDALCQGKERPDWDRENSVNKAYKSNGRGTAIGNEFAILLAPAENSANALTRHARLFQLNPHAQASPEWNVGTNVEAPMAARNDKQYPEAERLMNEDFPTGMFGMIEYLGDYGMWIYANTHNSWRQNLPDLHRIWQHSHYQHVGGSWLLYFRGNSPELLRWARAQSDNYMDVGIINYADPQKPIRAHVEGAMHHCKAFVPWGSAPFDMELHDVDIGIWGHCIDPDAYLYRYFIEGNVRAWDVYKLWGTAIHRGKLAIGGHGRDAVNTFGMILNYYRATWDPQAIIYWRAGADGIHEQPLETGIAIPSFPVWYKTWAERYHELTRDERPIAAIKNWIDAGYGHIAPNCFVSRMTGDRKYVDQFMWNVQRAVIAYRNPDDVLNGYSEYSGARRQETLMQLPRFLEAAKAAGITTLEPDAKTPSVYPATTVLALDPDDRAFHVRIQMKTTFQSSIKVIAPSGKSIKTIRIDPKVKNNYEGANAELVSIPADGETGVYTIELNAMVSEFQTPLTDLPHEIARLKPDKPCRVEGLQYGYLAIPPQSSATLQIAAMSYGIQKELSIPFPTVVRIRDASGRPVFETTLLEIGKRNRVTVDLKSENKIGVWPCMMASQWGPAVTWSGSASGVYFARAPGSFEPVLRAMPSNAFGP